MTDPKPLTGQVITNTLMMAGPIQFADLVVGLQSTGFDTLHLFTMLVVQKKAGKVIEHEGWWAHNSVSVLRLDEQQGATLHLLYESLDGLMSSVNSLVGILQQRGAPAAEDLRERVADCETILRDLSENGNGSMDEETRDSASILQRTGS